MFRSLFSFPSLAVTQDLLLQTCLSLMEVMRNQDGDLMTNCS